MHLSSGFSFQDILLNQVLDPQMRIAIQSKVLQGQGGRFVKNGTSISLHRLIKANTKELFLKCGLLCFQWYLNGYTLPWLASTAQNSITLKSYYYTTQLLVSVTFRVDNYISCTETPPTHLRCNIICTNQFCCHLLTFKDMSSCIT